VWAKRSIWILTCAGIFERHPALRLVPTEIAGTWLAQAVADIDSLYDSPLGGLRQHLPRRPRGDIETNVWLGARFPSRQEAADLVAHGLSNRTMWARTIPRRGHLVVD
jgi:hypothetical protein